MGSYYLTGMHLNATELYIFKWSKCCLTLCIFYHTHTKPLIQHNTFTLLRKETLTKEKKIIRLRSHTGTEVFYPKHNSVKGISVYITNSIKLFSGSHDHRIKVLTHGGFPGGAVVENLPANAGNMGSSPGLGRAHMLRSDWAREPRLLGLRVWSLCFAAGGAAMVRGPRTAMRSSPHLPQLEKALTQKRRPNTAINK